MSKFKVGDRVKILCGGYDGTGLEDGKVVSVEMKASAPWSVGERVLLLEGVQQNIVEIDRVSPTGRAWVGETCFNPWPRGDAKGQFGRWAVIPKIVRLTPELEAKTLRKARWLAAKGAAWKAIEDVERILRHQSESLSPEDLEEFTAGIRAILATQKDPATKRGQESRA